MTFKSQSQSRVYQEALQTVQIWKRGGGRREGTRHHHQVTICHPAAGAAFRSSRLSEWKRVLLPPVSVKQSVPPTAGGPRGQGWWPWHLGSRGHPLAWCPWVSECGQQCHACCVLRASVSLNYLRRMLELTYVLFHFRRHEGLLLPSPTPNPAVSSGLYTGRDHTNPLKGKSILLSVSVCFKMVPRAVWLQKCTSLLQERRGVRTGTFTTF